MKHTRKLIATSHGNSYSYWLAEDLYIYQKRAIDGAWIGWFCHQSVWESTFSKLAWMELV